MTAITIEPAIHGGALPGFSFGESRRLWPAITVAVVGAGFRSDA